jgi:tetratricopeptide (TPR) repeat protein
MKTERRHELATNALADWLGERIEALKPYSAAVSASALAIVIVVFASVIWFQNRESATANAWKTYFEALDLEQQRSTVDARAKDDARAKFVEISEDFAKSSPGLWARLSLADAQLAKGVDGLFGDRAGARKALDEAIDDYEAVLDTAPADSLLAERAIFGLASAYESKDELDNARRQYQTLLDRWPNGAFSSLAKARLADLDRKATKEFYDWFAKQAPKVTPPKGPGIPGEKPDFDLSKFPDHIFEPSVKVGGKKAGGAIEPENDSKSEAKGEPETSEGSSNEPVNASEGSDKKPNDAPPSEQPPAEKP